MKKALKIMTVFLVTFSMISFIGVSTSKAEKKSVGEQILDILLERGDIPHWKYNELKDQLKTEKKSTKWLEGLKFKGDLRLRYEGKYDQKSPGDKPDRDRFRYRLRVGFEKELYPDLNVAARFAGGGADSTSTNQSFDDAFENKDFWIDRIYATYKPSFLPGLELGGGKFKNPFVSTDIVWDSDVNPEGAYEKYTCSSWKSFQPFLILGQMVIEEQKGGKDASLLAWQGGFKAKITPRVKWTLAATYYDYYNLDESDLWEDYLGRNSGIDINGDGDVDSFLYGYHLLNFTSFIEFKVNNIPVKLFCDYVKNQANKVDDDTAFAAGFKLGKTKKKGSWELSYKYASIEKDAVIGAFCDSDFGHANREGHKAGVAYQLRNNVKFKVTGYFIEEEDGSDNEYNMIHSDIIFKF